MTALIGIHVAFALAALLIGITVLALPKGTSRHKLLGRIWVTAMSVVAIGSFQIRELNPDGSLSWIHILSIVTIVSMANAVYAIRRNRRRAHVSAMIGSMAGLVIAGAFTLDPDRVIGGFLF